MTEPGGPVVRRDIDEAASRPYDLVIVGAGVQGVTLALEALARGLRPLLVERGDFGSATTANTLRIIHGGLRYLQSMDLKRYFRSVEQRRWWFRTLPELVSPLPCLMPLYGDGVRRPGVFRGALWVNDLLGIARNKAVPTGSHIPGSRVVDATEACRFFPACRPDGLRGAALWHDGSMDHVPRLMIELVRWVTAAGGTALNYVSAVHIGTSRGAVATVGLRDELSGREWEVDTQVLLNSTGPAGGLFTRSAGVDRGAAPRIASAFNLLLRRRFDAKGAVAVSSGPGRPMRFLRPWGELTFAGTAHEALDETCAEPDEPGVSEAQIGRFLEDLNHATPGLEATPEDVVRVFAGLLPAGPDGVEALHRPVVVHHGGGRGPQGLTTVIGEKFTTAPALARSVLGGVVGRYASGGWERLLELRPRPVDWPLLAGPAPGQGVAEALRDHVETLRDLVGRECVQLPEDLLVRRLDWSMSDVDLADAASAVSRLGIVGQREVSTDRSPPPTGDR